MRVLLAASQALRLRRVHNDLLGVYPAQFVKDEFIFVHIPKCAGSNFLGSYLGYQLGHISVSEYYRENPSLFLKCFSCAFVRNPIDRFISAYNYINTCDLWPYLADVSALLRSRSESLSDLAENIHLLPEVSSLEWFRPQFEYVMIDGRVAVTRIFKTEYYQSAIDWIAANIGISLHCADPSINKRSERGLHYGNQEISPEGIANIRRFYWRDFTLFGYF